MSTTPTPQYSGPTISPNVDWEIRRHLQLIYQKLGNHVQAFQLLNAKVGGSSTTTTIIEGSSGGGSGGGGTPSTLGFGAVNSQVGNTSYTTQSGDDGALIILNDASPIAVTLGVGIVTPWMCFISNQGTGLATLTPASGNISYAENSAAASMPLPGGQACAVAFDGTNFWAFSWAMPANTPAVTHEWITAYNALTGAFTQAQPAFSDLSGQIQAGQVLSGTSASLGGSAMTAGQRITASVTITGATVGMVATCNPQTDPGAGFVWHAFVSAANTVTVCLTAALAGTPTASVYSVRVLP